MRKYLSILILALLPVLSSAGQRELKVLYWNIQNGMWDDQSQNYDNFVEYVKSLSPDICVWCEAESRYRSDSCVKMESCEEAYLPWNWDLLARRYGHEYVLVCGKNDTFPQVITSRYPIRIVKRINGDSGIAVVHGAGWAELQVGRRTLNFVTLHTWPFKYGYMAENQKESAKLQEGDEYRAKEIEYICKNTIFSEEGRGRKDWIMLGDFNAIARSDNHIYKRSDDDKAFLVHDYIEANTDYIDVIGSLYGTDFQKTTLSGKRIDFVYISPSLMKRLRSATVLREGFADSVRDPRKLHGFCNPSDHYPILLVLGL